MSAMEITDRRLFDSWMDAAFDRASGEEVTQT